jgi:ATP-dependent DNA ligase
LPLPHFTPADLKLIRDLFEHDDFIYELKTDSFRTLAHVGPEETRLVSRKGSVFKSFPDLSGIHIGLHCEAVLDGEIVILDSDGRPKFDDLLRRRGRGESVFKVFDLLSFKSEDLRSRPLIERKRPLRSIVPEQPSVLLYADHIERNGVEFFQPTCEQDLEGIVAKRKHGQYGEKWFKIRNPGYSQREGRRELFDRRILTNKR